MSAGQPLGNTFDVVARDSAQRVDLDTPVLRYAGNPLLTCHDVNRAWNSPGLQVTTVHNAGIAEYQGDIIMLFRSHLRCGISVLGLARSQDGLDFTVSPEPAMMPCTATDLFADGVDRRLAIENEAGGVEDPRITRIGETYYVTYSAYHAGIKDRVRVSLASTRDFVEFTRHGPVLDRDMRNVALFPEPIAERFVGLFRPNETGAADDVGGAFTEMRIGTTERIDSQQWLIGDEPLFRSGGGPSAFSDKIGPGAPPLKTRHGWLNIFHGVRSTMDGNPYVLGVALHELEAPECLRVCALPILFPSPADCAVAAADYVHVPNVVFTCGALRIADGIILIYYGGCDTVMNVGLSHEDTLAEMCRRYPMNLSNGQAAYDLRDDLPRRPF